MKKLKIKVFAIIFSILSTFIIGVLLFNNIREYTTQRSIIDNTLNHNISIDKITQNGKKEETTKRIFMDHTVYTVLFDNYGNLIGIINYTNNDTIDEASIKKIANKILETNNTEYISNLLFDNYSYLLNDANTLTIIDNTKETAKMQKYIMVSFGTLLILEIGAYFISKYLSKWVTDPVNESFEREKRFIADASHELKTPISVIMASTDAYNNDQDDKWIKNIKGESERMSKLVKDLLDLTKLENDRELIKREENLSKIIESSVLTFESLFFDQDLKLDYNIKDNIYFYCNQDSMKELMSILIDNAIKYSDKKSKVTVNLKKEENSIVLEVINKGIPILEKDKEKIFERFYKVDESRNRKFNNYGLGLSIAKRIVELHSGKITANSKDKLTTFKVVWSQK